MIVFPRPLRCPECRSKKFGKVIYAGAARFYAPKDGTEYSCPRCGYTEKRDK